MQQSPNNIYMYIRMYVFIFNIYNMKRKNSTKK